MYYTFDTELNLIETNPSPTDLHEAFLQGEDIHTKEKRFITSANTLKKAQHILVTNLIKEDLVIERAKELFPELFL